MRVSSQLLLLTALCFCGCELGGLSSDGVPLEHEGPAGPGQVGDACGADFDCGADLTCLEDAPGGLCTRGCDEETPCPEGSLCILSRTFLSETLSCRIPCDPSATSPCRGDLSCVQVGETELHVCTR